MDLLKTSEMMNSSDFKERFRAEYFQLKLRLEGLDKMLRAYKDGMLNFKPACSYDLLKSQSRVMKVYLDILKDRADIENINLEE